MGNLCDCPKENQGATSTTPLLTSKTNSHYNHVETEVTYTPTPITIPPGHSARRFKPEDRGFETSLEMLSPMSLVRIPTMPALDKTFQDHAKLYNELYQSFDSLRQCLNTFKSMFAEETAGIPTIQDCLRLLSQRCGGELLSGSRTKNCIEIQYDARKVSQVCQGPAEDVLQTLQLYNQANKTIKRILEKATQVQSSIQLILEDEVNLKKEVMKADLDGKLGPEPLRMTSDNLIKLRKLPERIDTIQKYTTKTFDEICRGSKPLFERQG